MTAAPVRSLLEQLGPGEAQHEYGGDEPVDEVLNEIKQARISPVDVLDSEDDGAALGDELE
jgi:hypothetical protein